jgi:hypothetical protein
VQAEEDEHDKHNAAMAGGVKREIYLDGGGV